MAATSAGGGGVAAAAAVVTPEAILKRVQGAVLAVLGSAVGEDEPLVDAGLDSLGVHFTLNPNLHPPCSCILISAP